MKLESQFTFQGPREKVWDLLQDPEVMKTALPGAQKLEKTGEDTYAGTMRVGVGPVNGVFSVHIVLKDKIAPESYTMLVDSKGGPGFVKGTAHVELSEQENGITLMKYEATLQIGGRLAVVGQRLLDTVAKSMTRQGLEKLNKALQARLDADSK